MPQMLQTGTVAGRVNWYLWNQTTAGENFCEKWNKHPERAVAFFEWHGRIVADVERLACRLGGTNGAGGERCGRDRRVEMATRHRAIGKGKHHDGQTMGERNRGDAGQTDSLAKHGCGASTDEYQGEGTDELDKELGCDPAEHC
jgi:hypothetical protein